MKCSQCGQTTDSTDKFCSNCGNVVESTESAQTRVLPFPRAFEMICLMSGVPLTSDIRSELYKTACEMGRKGCERKALNYDGFEATITTNFSYCAFNSMGGVKFTAEIESDTVKGKVVFLITKFDYTEDGIWVPLVPIPRSHPASAAQYN